MAGGTAFYNYKGDKISPRELEIGLTAEASTPLKNRTTYGAWYFVVNFGSADNVYSMFAVDNERPFGNNGNGYYLGKSGVNVSLGKLTAGSGANLDANIFTVDYNKEYEFFVAHNTNGQFRVWIRGEAYTTWASGGTLSIDNDFKIGGFFAFVCTASYHYLYDLIEFPYGGGLEPDDVPWLRD